MKRDELDLIETAVKRATERGRKKLGGPPSEDELLAYRRGELSPEERDRVEERLAHHPEAVRRLLDLPKPPGGTPPVADTITDDEVRQEWHLLQARLAGRGAPPPPVTRPLSKVLVLAAAASFLIGVIGIGTATVAWREAISPKTGIGDLQLFPAEALRGPESHVAGLEAEFENYDLTLMPMPDQEIDYPRYRLEIAAEDSPARPIFSTDALRPNIDGSFSLFLSRAFLTPGVYEIRLYGLRGDQATPLWTYRLRA